MNTEKQTRNTPEENMYNIIRKHSDENWHIIDNVATKAEARNYIKSQIAELEKLQGARQTVKSMDDVTVIRFDYTVKDLPFHWAVGYWFETEQETNKRIELEEIYSSFN